MFLIVDFLNLAYRSFYAIRSLNNTKGIPTNAVFGFIKTVRKWCEDLSPTHLAIVLEPGQPTRRLEILPEYKANRPPTPDDLPSQLEELTNLFPQLGWPTATHPSEEADDLGAALALEGIRKGLEVRIASNDKDFLQILRPGMKLLRSTPKEVVEADEAWLKKRWGIEPEQVIDFLSMVGDGVDNIDGVPGVGEKTATDLIQRFGSYEGILKQLDQVTRPKLRESLSASRQIMDRNRSLIRLNTDIPVPNLDEFLLKPPQYPSLLQSLETLEFKSLLALYRDEMKRSLPPAQGDLFKL